MRRWVWVAVVAVVFSARPEPALGQTVDTVFVGTKHSPWTSGFVEFFVPTAGFAYAGDWKRGLLPNAFRLGAYIGFDQTYDEGSDTCEDSCTGWGIAVLATTVWAIVGAVQTANDYNAVIREPEPEPAILVGPSRHGGVSVGVRIAL